MSETFQLREFEPKGSHHIFLDTNVLLYAFAPLAEYKVDIQEQITKFFEVCKSVNANLYVTSLVLSEVSNVVIRDDFQAWKIKPENARKDKFKDHYRQTENYKEIIDFLNSVNKNIIKLASPFPDDFQLLDLDKIGKMCYNGDFNDCYFLEIAARKKWMIFTRDNDLIHHPLREVPVITNLKY
ncbi:type II toxin-antitoxin system VapC family toxin [Mucilaginibacter flavidus]|uniref:type II toxin-antitoxin system VapC family toxin n=1 Tax=Mucilaginibacter flavidus TaxID=2949309 RepID=UPI00209315A5|nr:PIN domain-containing protein [Mucilaginibacter flavidus]MCO5950855.1 PIN domain-containing protein [Mucilaginibacter flavidus]